MERREIEIFLALADELHFGRTAERLHVSQARVSQTIKQVERQIGAPLFERTSRRVSLTPIGRQLQDDLAPAYQRILDGIARATAAGRGIGGVLRVGFEAPALADLMSDTLDRFRQQAPGCEIEIREVDFTDPLRMLRSGDVDVLVTLFPLDEPDLTAGPIVHSEPMVLAVSAKHPFARREGVTLEDLARDTVLRAARPPKPYWQDDPWFTPSGAPITRGQPFGTFQELMLAIANGKGICPLAAHASEFFARPNVAFIPFTGTPAVQWGMTWRTAGETNRVRILAGSSLTTAVSPKRT
jgi:DNA-binding transcriptional LysR family regulator